MIRVLNEKKEWFEEIQKRLQNKIIYAIILKKNMRKFKKDKE